MHLDIQVNKEIKNDKNSHKVIKKERKKLKKKEEEKQIEMDEEQNKWEMKVLRENNEIEIHENK